eukprot:gene16-7_t
MGKKDKKSSSKSKKAQERRERKALEEQIRNCKEKCEEARAFLEPVGRNAEPNYVKAKACLDAAIAIYNSHPPAFFYQAECHRGQGQYEEAIAQYSHALDLQPVYVQAWKGVHLPHAMEDYSSIIEFEPNNDHAYNMRGLCYLIARVPGLRMKKAEYHKCVGDFQTAIRLNEANYYAICNLGKVYEDQGEMDLAVEAYTSALRVKEDYTTAQFRRGCAALRWVELNTRTRFSVDEFCDNPCAVKVLDDGSDEKHLPSLQDIEEEIKNKMIEKKRQEGINVRLEMAIKDLTGLLPNPETTNKLLADVSVVLNLGVCYLLKDDLVKAAEYFKYTDEIIQSRPGMVADGDAPPIEDLETIKKVVALRKKELEHKKSRKAAEQAKKEE